MAPLRKATHTPEVMSLMSGRRIIEQTASYSQMTLSGDCISVLFIRLCPVNERYGDFATVTDEELILKFLL